MTVRRSIRDIAGAARYALHTRDRQLVSFLTPQEKRQVLATFADQASIFIETGTYKGETARAMAERFELVHTIEIDPEMAARATRSLADLPNVEVHVGDSAAILPQILDGLAESAVIWLDAHYSGPHTGRSQHTDTPIMAELRLIFANSRTHHVILIDDARLFIGRRGYPSLAALGRFVLEESDYVMTVRDDIIRLIFDPEWSLRHRASSAGR